MRSLFFSLLILAAVSAADTSNNSSRSSNIRSWLGKLGGGSQKPPKPSSPLFLKNKQPTDESVSKDDDDDEDVLTHATFIAETNLPTDLGLFRLRAYRHAPSQHNVHVGTEPCVIYSADKPPFGTNNNDDKLLENVPVRVHDQCFTSEVFRSQRYVGMMMYV